MAKENKTGNRQGEPENAPGFSLLEMIHNIDSPIGIPIAMVIGSVIVSAVLWLLFQIPFVEAIVVWAAKALIVVMLILWIIFTVLHIRFEREVRRERKRKEKEIMDYYMRTLNVRPQIENPEKTDQDHR